MSDRLKSGRHFSKLPPATSATLKLTIEPFFLFHARAGRCSRRRGTLVYQSSAINFVRLCKWFTEVSRVSSFGLVSGGGELQVRTEPANPLFYSECRPTGVQNTADHCIHVPAFTFIIVKYCGDVVAFHPASAAVSPSYFPPSLPSPTRDTLS